MKGKMLVRLMMISVMSTFIMPNITYATGQTLYGLSGLPLNYYAFVLGPSASSTFFGMHFWEAPYKGPQSEYAHLYFSAPGGISISFINHIEVAFCATLAMKRVNRFQVNEPMLDYLAVSEMGLGDWRFSAKGLIITQERAKVDLGVIFFLDLPMGRADRTRLNTRIGDDPLNRRALTQLTESESRFGGDGTKNYNWGIIEAITRRWYPKDDYNIFTVTGNVGYVVRTGTIRYANTISDYRIDPDDPLNFDINTDISKRADYFLLGGGVEVTPFKMLSCIFDSQFKIFTSVLSDQVLHPNQRAARHLELLTAVRINHYDLYHLTIGFGKTFGKWSVNYANGTLTNQNYNLYVTVGTDLPTAPVDTDGDGIPDSRDLAPKDPEDFDNFQDYDGAPEPDNDNDGVPDINDGAPNDPEDIDGWEDTDGVPDPDNDGDGILDLKDGAPNEPETFNGYMDEDGIPDEVPVKKPEVKRMTLKGLNFKPNTAELLPGSYPSLDEAAKILKEFPEITVTIEGHAASVGRPNDELMVSQLRAETIKNTLVTRYGIDPGRIKTIGYGSTVPIADNSTEAGRSMNRRIEFVVNE
ncbi:MAG: OmpA family protein [bacterium]